MKVTVVGNLDRHLEELIRQLAVDLTVLPVTQIEGLSRPVQQRAPREEWR